jgi:hypothetical protein
LPTIERRAVTMALDATKDTAIVHAAALSRGPSTVLLLAPSGSGKTTLTLGLIGRGWAPFGDDLSLISTASLRVRPFPRCFHVAPASMQALRSTPELEWSRVLSTYARPEHWAESEHQPTTILLIERDPERPTALSPVETQAEAAGAILDATVHNQVAGSELARVAVRLAAQARRCDRLNNGVLEEALDLIEAASAE